MKLNLQLKSSIESYFTGRDNQSKIKWDKEACLTKIETVVFDQGFSRFQACAGTFWLTKNGTTYKMDEDNYTDEISGEPAISVSNPLRELGFA